MRATSRPYLVPALIAVALLVCGPLVGRFSPSHQDLLITVLLYAYWATVWNFLGGLAGQLSFGHATFIGAGAYTSSILFVKFGVNRSSRRTKHCEVAVKLRSVIGDKLIRFKWSVRRNQDDGFGGAGDHALG